MKNKTLQKSRYFLIFLALITLHFNLTTSDYTNDPELIRITAHYKKIIKNWNTRSWQYGPSYQVADRKALLEAITKDIKENKISGDPETIKILDHIASTYEHYSPEYAVIESVKNYIPSIVHNMYNLEINRYIDKTEHILAQTQTFWISHPNLLNREITNLSERDYDLLKKACTLGDELQKYNLLEIFAHYYISLNDLIAHLHSVNHHPILDTLLKKTQSYMQSLYTYIPLHKIKALRKGLSQTQQKKHEMLELILRLDTPISIEVYTSQKLMKNVIKHNLQHYQATQNVLGEGNCGYRAFLGSVFINSLKSGDFKGTERLQELVSQQFIPLFKKYAGPQPNSYKLSVPIGYNIDKKVEIYQTLVLTEQQLQAIQQTLLHSLNAIKQYESIHDIENLFNKNPNFDFFMIMFIRTLIAEELLKPENLEHKMLAAFTREQDEDDYFVNLLRWTIWIDQPELTILNRITGIDINLIQEKAEFNSLIKFDYGNKLYGHADILFVNNNHYLILHPK